MALDTTGKKIVQLLQSDELQLRLVAARVAAEIKLKGREVTAALLSNLDTDNEPLKIYTLRALASTGSAKALDEVARTVRQSGAIRDHAVSILGAAGSAGIEHLAALYNEENVAGKKSVGAALSRLGGLPALDALLSFMPGESPDQIRFLVIGCRRVMETLPEKSHGPALTRLRKFISMKRTVKSPEMLSGGLSLLGFFQSGKMADQARTILSLFLEKKFSLSVREKAMDAYLALPPPNFSATILASLLKLVCEPEWHPVPRGALQVLRQLEIPPRSVHRLVPLLSKSPHYSAHVYVLQQLRGQDKPEYVKKVLAALENPHYQVKEAAESTLRTLPSSMDALFKLLMQSDESDMTRRIGAILTSFPEDAKRKYRARATQRLLSLFEKEDPRYSVYLQFVRDMDPKPLQKKMEQRIKALRSGSRKDRFERIARLYGLLAENSWLPDESRIPYVVALLQISDRNLTRAARNADPVVLMLHSLVREDPEGTAAAILRQRSLAAEHLYYLGFHFAEEGGFCRPFARAMLEHVVKKYPRGKLKKPAALKIKIHRLKQD